MSGVNALAQNRRGITHNYAQFGHPKVVQSKGWLSAIVKAFVTAIRSGLWLLSTVPCGMNHTENQFTFKAIEKIIFFILHCGLTYEQTK